MDFSNCVVIVNVASIAAVTGLPFGIAEAHLQMAINAQAIKRQGEPAEVAALICLLASDEASFITGSAHLVDGGYAAA